MQNKSKAIITSASNKFFPSLLNMIGSMKQNYPNHPHIYVYNLGLSSFCINQLKSFENVTVLEIPHFVPFWRSCYTWKTYILKSPLADLNFYIDAGNQILKSLDGLFDKIDQNGYLLVSQGPEVSVSDITPSDYFDIFDVSHDLGNKEIIAAGIFGFKNKGEIENITHRLYGAASNGLSLGFSVRDQWKNKGKNKNMFVRDCNMFRHDTTLITLLVLKYMTNPVIEDIRYFDGQNTNTQDQYMWNLRMNYSKLEYIQYLKLTPSTRVFLFLFYKAKSLNRFIKFGLKSKLKLGK